MVTQKQYVTPMTENQLDVTAQFGLNDNIQLVFDMDKMEISSSLPRDVEMINESQGNDKSQRQNGSCVSFMNPSSAMPAAELEDLQIPD